MQHRSTEDNWQSPVECRLAENTHRWSTSQDVTFSGEVSTVPKSIEAPGRFEKNGKHSRSKQRLSDMPKKKGQMR